MFRLFRRSATAVARRPCCSGGRSSTSEEAVAGGAQAEPKEAGGRRRGDVDELLARMRDCCRAPARRARGVRLLRESGDRLSERALHLKHLARHIQLSNHLGVADRWKIEFLVEEALKGTTLTCLVTLHAEYPLW